MTKRALQKTAHQPTLLASERHYAIIPLGAWFRLRRPRESSAVAVVLDEKIAEAQNA